METTLPLQVPVNGMRSPDGQIEYLGIATLQSNGKYHCYAILGGCLAAVEVTITPTSGDKS